MARGSRLRAVLPRGRPGESGGSDARACSVSHADRGLICRAQITTAHGSPKRIADLRRTFKDLVRRNPEVGKTYEYLDSREKIVEKMPQLANANIDVRLPPLLQPFRRLLTAFLRVFLQGWEAYWVPDGGWVAAVDTIDSVGRELERLGVKTVWGKCVPALVLSSPCRPSDVFC
jgi:hypothetical protein